MQIRSVALLGAGAVGSYVIWGLTERENLRFGVVAEGARAERLARDGCAINGETKLPMVAFSVLLLAMLTIVGVDIYQAAVKGE